MGPIWPVWPPGTEIKKLLEKISGNNLWEVILRRNCDKDLERTPYERTMGKSWLERSLWEETVDSNID